MRGICCQCQTEHNVTPAFNPCTDDENPANGWVMDWHSCEGEHCSGVGSVPQAIVPDKFRSCMRCIDKVSGKIGDFIHRGDFRAISPVFRDILDLLRWMKMNGYEEQPFINGNNYDPFRVIKTDKVLT